MPRGLCGIMMLSSSVDVPSPGGMSAVAARNVIRSSSISGAMYNLEKSPSSTGPDATGLVGNKKRRSSLGAKMVAIVGLSQWSKSTLQLNQQGGQLWILQLPCCSLSDSKLVVSFASVCSHVTAWAICHSCIECSFVSHLISFLSAFLHLCSTFLLLVDFPVSHVLSFTTLPSPVSLTVLNSFKGMQSGITGPKLSDFLTWGFL